MDGHTGRVGSLAWNMYIVSSGARDGCVVHHDVRQRDHAVATLHAHTQEVGTNLPTQLIYYSILDMINTINCDMCGLVKLKMYSQQTHLHRH